MIYVVVSLAVMLGFCSLAVDLGRVQVAKTELRRAADAAARAGVAQLLSSGTSAAQSAAISMAAQNYCDGSAVVLTNSQVQVGIWNSSSHSFSTSGTPDNITTFNAIKVMARRTQANGNPIPLVFGEIIGVPTCDIEANSIVALVSVTAPLTQYVSSHGDPWLAGEPAGTQGSMPDTSYSNKDHPWKYDVANPGVTDTSSTTNSDSSKLYSTDYTSGEPYASPVGYSVQPGAVVQITVPDNSSNEALNSGYLYGNSGTYYANGSNGGTYNIYSDDAANPSLAEGTQTTSGSEHGISNIEAPLNSLLGVFLDQTGSTSGADSETPGTGLDFSTQTARDYTTLQPTLNQSFYVGDGTNSSNVQQTIVVPANASKLFLGTMDGHEWSNNVGGYNATITQFQIETVQ
ncbi:MAG: pilus assembly protein TadG-related protein [Tepidisphaeraceae bacterium]